MDQIDNNDNDITSKNIDADNNNASENIDADESNFEWLENTPKAKIVKMRYYNEVGVFYYDGLDSLNINDRFVVQINDDIEFATVVCFPPQLNVQRYKSEGDENSEDSKNSQSPNEANQDKNASENKNAKNAKKKKQFKRNEQKTRTIIRRCSDEDYQRHLKNKEDEKEAFKVCKEKIAFHKLNIKLVEAHYSLNRAKLLFEFVSETRIDFRELVKDLAAHFHTRIELRQIGVRDEAKVFGGCSICGRELCCRVIKSNFETITIKMAKDQNMPLNTAKISGQCGRLMCCIYYEYNTYRDLKRDLPSIGSKVLFNGEVAVIREINIVSRNFLIETEDRRRMYVKIPDLKNKKNNMIVVEAE